MSEAIVADVRRFNRTVTAQVGALDDRFLGRDRPLGEARLLWEIGPEGCELRALRARLGARLRLPEPPRCARSRRRARRRRRRATADRRTRVARLTAAGRAERELLDERSDELAARCWSRSPAASGSGSSPRCARSSACSPRRSSRSRRSTPPTPTRAAACAAYFAELDRRSEAGFDPAASDIPAAARAAPAGRRAPRRLPARRAGRLRRAQAPRRRGRARSSACGSPTAVRGLGLGRRLLAELEARAARPARDGRPARHQPQPHRGDRHVPPPGYAEVAPFNDEPFAHHWFEKRL